MVHKGECNFCSRVVGAQVADESDRIKRLVEGNESGICERCVFTAISDLAKQCPSVIMAVAFNHTTTVGQLLSHYRIEDYLSKVGIDPSGMTISDFFAELQKAIARTVEVMESRSGPGILEKHMESLRGECEKKREEIADLERAISETQKKLEEIKRYALPYAPPPENAHEATNPDIFLELGG